MNKLLLAVAGLATLAGLAVLLPLDAGHAQGPQGQGPSIMVPSAPAGTGQAIPGNSTAALFQGAPAAAPAPQYGPTTPGSQAAPPTVDAPVTDERPHALRDYLNENFDHVAMNDDIAVQPTCGQFMICLNWYSGPDAPQSARQLTLELRGPDYNLKNVYVFTKGVEERKAEIKRIQADIEQKQAAFAKLNLDMEPHIRVPVTRYEIQCAVLVGGYKDLESAHRALEQLKKCSADMLKDKNIPLHSVGQVQFDKDGKPCGGGMGLVNPFTHAMVVANPSIKPPEQPKGFTPDYLALLRALNENEPLSLLKCPKKYTLVVKQYSMPASIDSKKSSSSMLEKLGLGGSGNKVDAAGESAHNLATLLNGKSFQKEHLTAWVLHTKYCSYVTVGAFDDPQDSRIQFLQEELPKLNTCKDALRPGLQLVATPRLMPVPR